MIRIAITEAAFEAIARTPLRGSVDVEPEANERGERTIRLPREEPGRRTRFGVRLFPHASPRNQSALWRLSCAAARRRVRHRRGKEVGYVVLQGREPFDLVAQRLPSAVAVNGLVAATVPIYSPRFPSNTADVRILLNPEQAEDLARQLLLEAKNARERL